MTIMSPHQKTSLLMHPLKIQTSLGVGNGVNERQKANVMDVKPKLMHGLDEINSALPSTMLVHLFLVLFPRDYLENIVLRATNENIKDENGEVTFGEVLRSSGIWFFLATTSGFPRRDFFSHPISVKFGAPYRVNMYMSRKIFESILFSLSFTMSSPPSYLDRFWQIRDQCVEPKYAKSF